MFLKYMSAKCCNEGQKRPGTFDLQYNKKIIINSLCQLYTSQINACSNVRHAQVEIPEDKT